MQKLCSDPIIISPMHSYAFICTKYAKICKICKHEIYMQHMQKYALPTLLMHGKGRKDLSVEHSGEEAVTGLHWCSHDDISIKLHGQKKEAFGPFAPVEIFFVAKVSIGERKCCGGINWT